jgi:hypothetical protein
MIPALRQFYGDFVKRSLQVFRPHVKDGERNGRIASGR